MLWSRSRSDARRFVFTLMVVYYVSWTGYFIIPALSVGGELRYQRWLKNSAMPESDARRDTATAALGIRAHFKINDTMWLRPGVAFVQPIDAPMTDQSYHVAQLDVPFAF